MQNMKNNTTLSGIDPLFLVSFSFLVVIGLAILQSASSIASYNVAGHVYVFFTRQLLQGILPGILLFGIMASIPYGWFKKLSFLIFFGALCINLFILIPGVGVERLGATRWIDLGIVSFQPSELMKLGAVLYIAGLLTKLSRVGRQRGIVTGITLITGIIFAVVSVLQTDLSTGVLIAAIIASMIFQSPIKFHWIVLLVTLFLLLVGILASTENFRVTRIQTFLRGPGQVDLQDENKYHFNQNMIAVGSGGLTGVGWNQSRQKFNYVPEPIGDSVFAVFAEESGFIGVVLLMGIFVVVAFRLLRIAYSLHEPYGQYVLIGIVTWFVFQAFLNVGSTLGIIPITGMTLPFVSYGSSSLWVLFMAFGIVANITKYRTVK